MKILLDTNFILTAVKQKIDFDSLANELFDARIEWLIPVEVVGELEDLAKRRGMRIHHKQAAEVSLQLIEKIKYKKIKLKDKNVDQGIVHYANKHKIAVATLDRKLKSKLHGKVLTIRGKKSLEIV